MAAVSKVEVNNKKAEYLYQLMDRVVAGIVLSGTEIKSIRNGGGSLHEAFCIFKGDELYIKNMNIPVYSHGNLNNHDPYSVRKLLLKKRELERMQSKVKERGVAIIPVRLFANERGFVKVEVALARGKKSFDKRESIKKRESKVELARVLKKYK